MLIADEATPRSLPSGLLLRNRASHEARCGKCDGKEGAEFEYDAEQNLLDLQAELLGGGYNPCPYQNFWIHDPQRRKISAAPFRDRVVRDALCEVIEPLLSARNLRT